MVLTMERYSSSTVQNLHCVSDSEANPHCMSPSLSLETSTRAKSMLCSLDASIELAL